MLASSSAKAIGKSSSPSSPMRLPRSERHKLVRPGASAPASHSAAASRHDRRTFPLLDFLLLGSLHLGRLLLLLGLHALAILFELAASLARLDRLDALLLLEQRSANLERARAQTSSSVARRRYATAGDLVLRAIGTRAMCLSSLVISAK